MPYETFSTGRWGDEWEDAHGKACLTSISMKVAEPMLYELISPGTHKGSGNIVNKKRGLLLTNRHVAGGGPCWGFAEYNQTRKVGYLAWRMQIGLIEHVQLQCYLFRPITRRALRRLEFVGRERLD